MMNDNNNQHARISCEEFFTEDFGPADWANESEQPQPEPSHKEQHGRCEDAPCCGCCGPDYSDGYGSPADDAWHDANEYPDW